MRAVGWLGTSFVWVGLSEPLMLAYMSQSTFVGKVEGRLGGAGCMLMSRAVRQTRVAAGGQASEHQARATWVNMLLCARWRVTHLFLSLRILFRLYVHMLCACYALCACYVHAMCMLCACCVHDVCMLCACYVHAMCMLCARYAHFGAARGRGGAGASCSKGPRGRALPLLSG